MSTGRGGGGATRARIRGLVFGGTDTGISGVYKLSRVYDDVMLALAKFGSANDGRFSVRFDDECESWTMYDEQC
jgi:hypothetical protein